MWILLSGYRHVGVQVGTELVVCALDRFRVNRAISLLKGKGVNNVSEKDIESSLTGHICRCTGYRPITEAMKSLLNDPSPGLDGCLDLEVPLPSSFPLNFLVIFTNIFRTWGKSMAYAKELVLLAR